MIFTLYFFVWKYDVTQWILNMVDSTLVEGALKFRDGKKVS